MSMIEHAVVIAGGGPTGLMLAGELALAGATVAWRFERRSGDAPSEICRLADELGASAIVVGRSRRRRQIFRHRSTRARIVEVASQPVLVVPEPEPCAAHG